MNSIEDIKKYMKTWSMLTYKQGIDNCYALKKESDTYRVTVNVLKTQNLLEKKMDGRSVEAIPIKNEGDAKIIFSDIFWSIADGFISPASYVVSIVNECLKRKIDEVEISGIVGRGLRAFPSFLREMDLICKMAKYFPGATVHNNPTQDVNDHTDILIQHNGNDYRIWSYQNSKRGLENTSSRIKEQRGEIPKGIHVLCPIDVKNEYMREEVMGWYLYSERYVKYIHEMLVIEQKDDFETIKRMNEYAIKTYLGKANTLKK